MSMTASAAARFPTTAFVEPMGRGGSAIAGIALPAGLATRPRGRAWAAAVLVHVAVFAAIVLVPSPPRPIDAAPIRLVFHDPPPPPAPLGAPAAAPAPEPVPPVAMAKPVVPKRLKRVVAAAPKPRPVVREVPPAAPVAAAPLGIAEGSAVGITGGVAAGVDGGVVGGSGTGPMPASQVAHPPVLLRRVEPAYPRDVRRREIGGLVLLQAVLDREGRVERDVRVVESVPMLDDEAVTAVRQWRFRPARNERGEALRVVLEIPIRFVLH